MDTLWLMCGIAVVAVGLLMLFGGSKGRSLDEVYARRARADAPGLAPQAPAEAPTAVTPVTVVVPEPGRHRVAT